MPRNRLWTLKLLFLLTITASMMASSHAAPTSLPTFSSILSNPYSECPPNSDTIWVRMDNYGTTEETIINVPFEADSDETDADGSGPDFATSDVNYVTGVLWGEIHPRLPYVSWWSPESIRAVAVAARTLAYDWCGTYEYDGHRGMDDSNKQAYRPHYSDPGFDESDKERYRLIEESTMGIHMTYESDVFDVQYRTLTGSWTDDGDPRPPHVAVPDPVGANYEPTREPGMAQVNADHWASGSDPTVDDRFHPCWSTYRHILVHYYTDVHLRNASGERLTPLRRWNPLSLDLHNPPHNATPIMETGGAYMITVVIQNTSTVPWLWDEPDQYYAFSYRWYDPRDPENPLDGSNQAKIQATVNEGATTTVTLTIDDVPDWEQGAYRLKLDMVRWHKITPLQLSKSWLSDLGDWPTYDLSVCLNSPCQTFLPVTLKNY